MEILLSRYHSEARIRREGGRECVGGVYTFHFLQRDTQTHTKVVHATLTLRVRSNFKPYLEPKYAYVYYLKGCFLREDHLTHNRSTPYVRFGLNEPRSISSHAPSPPPSFLNPGLARASKP